MQTARYYRDYAKRARRLMGNTDCRDVVDALERLARDFEEIATDLETGTVEILCTRQKPRRDFGDRNDPARLAELAVRSASMTRH